jgi:hypothetical protein
MSTDPDWTPLRDGRPSQIPGQLFSAEVLIALIDPTGRLTKRLVAYAIYRETGEPSGRWRTTTSPAMTVYDGGIYGWHPLPPMPKQPPQKPSVFALR